VDLDIRETGSTCVLKLKGSFKNESVRAFSSAVESAFSSGRIYIILNLQDVPMIDSSGIGAVVNALRRARELGGDVKLVNPSTFARKTFTLVGIWNLFGVFATEDEAAAACA